MLTRQFEESVRDKCSSVDPLAIYLTRPYMLEREDLTRYAALFGETVPVTTVLQCTRVVLDHRSDMKLEGYKTLFPVTVEMYSQPLPKDVLAGELGTQLKGWRPARLAPCFDPAAKTVCDVPILLSCFYCICS